MKSFIEFASATALALALVFVFFLLSLLSCQPSLPSITFEVESQTPLDANETVYITGNQASLGTWNPSAISLQKESGIWTGVFTFPPGTQLEFKFTKGSWGNEALNADGGVPANHQFVVTDDTTLHYSISSWRDSLLKVEPEITGDYRIHDDFPVKGLDARRVIVWLPPSYETETSRQYPVLYMLDGQNVFDPHTSSMGYDWRVDEIADSLIQKNEIEEFICVAVYCDADVRAREYSDDPDLGEKYQDFMCCQLKPWIDSTYRTNPSAENTAVMGASMGGLISFILAWEYPDVFSKAACMSPAFKVSVGSIKVDYVEDVVADQTKNDIELYIDNGTLDLEATLQPGIDVMLKALDAKDYEYTWFLDQGATHNERAWSARAWKPLLQFFAK